METLKSPTNKKSELHFLLILIVGALALAFLIFRPFIYALILATVFATAFEPIHKKILKFTHGKNSLAAFLSTITVLITVIVPLVFLGIQIFREATQLYNFLIHGGTNIISQTIENILQNLRKTFPIPADFSIDTSQYLQQGVNWFVQNLGPLFANIANMVIGIFIFLIAIYCLFKDGKGLKKILTNLSPLENIHDETIFSKIKSAINSVVKGSLSVALLHGVIIAIGFTIFGIPNPALWGSITAILALIPGIGIGSVIFLSVTYLALTGQTLAAIGLLFWGIADTGLVDSYIGPRLIKRGTGLHPFLIVISILGGISLFGPLGYLLGPLTLSLLFALLEIYFSIRQR